MLTCRYERGGGLDHNVAKPLCTHVVRGVLGQRIEVWRVEADGLVVREGVEGRLASVRAHAALPLPAKAALFGQAATDQVNK